MAGAVPIGNSNPRYEVLRNPFRLLISAEPWLALVFMLSSFAVGLFWFVVLVSLIATGFGLAITLMGVPILAGTVIVWVYGAKFERLRVRALLREQIDDPYLPAPEGGYWVRYKAQIFDRHTWLDLLYLLLLFPIGIAEFVIAVVGISLPFGLVFAPAYYWIGSGPQIANWNVDELPEALILTLVGLPLVIGLPYLFVGVGRGHAWFARQLLGTSREMELTDRVEQLTDSRSRAVDTAMTELRRIERDLHDGAQQRLVKLSMDLGMAKEKLSTDPAGAQALIEEAHEEAKRAMTEIRNLARGIHPVVLTDRGLGAAVQALASRSAVPTNVEVDLDQRLPEAVESTAYFIVAEGLTNISRHSGASEAIVRIGLDADKLVIDIEDDGAGGADPAGGTGLEGIQNRAAALDGSVTIDSPSGGPTRIHVELPCKW